MVNEDTDERKPLSLGLVNLFSAWVERKAREIHDVQSEIDYLDQYLLPSAGWIMDKTDEEQLFAIWRQRTTHTAKTDSPARAPRTKLYAAIDEDGLVMNVFSNIEDAKEYGRHNEACEFVRPLVPHREGTDNHLISAGGYAHYWLDWALYMGDSRAFFADF